MTAKERLQKVSRKIDSAIIHIRAVAKEADIDDVRHILRQLKRARDMVNVMKEKNVEEEANNINCN